MVRGYKMTSAIVNLSCSQTRPIPRKFSSNAVFPIQLFHQQHLK